MSVDIAILVGVGGALIAFFGYVLNRDNNKKNSAVSEAGMKVTLDHIVRVVDDIKVDVKTSKEQMNELSRNLARIEEITKSAQQRIDKLEQKKNEN